MNLINENKEKILSRYIKQFVDDSFSRDDKTNGGINLMWCNFKRKDGEHLPIDCLNGQIEWEDLRDILTETGFNLKEIVLASFVEDDEENEYGVIINSDLKIMEYSRSTQNGKNNVNYFELNDITNKEHKIKEYPQIFVASNMIKKGIEL